MERNFEAPGGLNAMERLASPNEKERVAAIFDRHTPEQALLDHIMNRTSSEKETAYAFKALRTRRTSDIPWRTMRELLEGSTHIFTVRSARTHTIALARSGKIPTPALLRMVTPGAQPGVDGWLSDSDSLRRLTRVYASGTENVVSQSDGPLAVPALAPEILVLLSAAPDLYVQLNVCVHPQCPPEAMRALASSTQIRVRERLAERGDLTPDALALLIAGRSSHVRRVAGFQNWAQLTRLEPELIAKYVKDAVPVAGISVAKAWNLADPAVTPTVVRVSLAANQLFGRLPELTEQLTHDPEAVVRAQAAAWAPWETVSHLLVDLDPIVRAALTKNPAVPAEALALLAVDPSRKVARAASVRLARALAA